MSAPVTDAPVRQPSASRADSHRATLSVAIVLQLLISAGDGLAMVALATRVYQGSHASWAVASVFLAVTVPITALAPVAGLLLDRLSPRPVLIAAAVAQALVALVLVRVTGVGATLGLSVGFGLCAAVLQPGLGAMVPKLAGSSGVTRANGYLQAATWGGFTAGPLLAGLLTAAGGTGLALAGVAVTYGLGAVGLRLLRLPAAGTAPEAAPAAQPTPETAAAARPTPETAAAARPTLETAAAGDGHGHGEGQESLRYQLSAGIRFLRSDAEAGLLVCVVGIMVAFANMAVVAEVSFAEGVLHAGSTGYSLLVAGWTAGMLAGTLAAGRLRRRLALATLIGTLVTGAGVALAGGAVTLWQATAAYGLGGLANGVEVVTTRSFINHRAPALISGRVFALYSAVLFGAASVGMATAGVLLDPLNPRLVLVIAGSGGILAGVAGLLIHIRLRARLRDGGAADLHVPASRQPPG